MPLLEVEDLNVHFDTRHGLIRAVDGISFSLEPGKILGIVGESGSGKSVTTLALLGLIACPPGKAYAKRADFKGQNALHMNEKQLQKIRGNEISMIFQEPMTALNPYLKIRTQLVETLIVHEHVTHQEAGKRALEMMQRVGIPDPHIRIDQYPHEFSGGMRQRVCIAMALLTRPSILIADEPTTALDVTIQAQILDIIRELKDDLGMSVILISHDLGVVSQMSDEIVVMYAGKVAERGKPAELFQHTSHPYTKGLIESIPRLDTTLERLTPIAGSPPDPANLPSGCPFHARCSYVKDICRTDYPQQRERSASHNFRCHVDIN